MQLLIKLFLVRYPIVVTGKNNYDQCAFVTCTVIRKFLMMIRLYFIVITAIAAISDINADNLCPERNGRFPLGNQCDKYLQCENGIPSEKFCPDGLFFNSKASIFSYPCQYPPEVDCEGRTQLQPPQPTRDCARQFGYFRLGDETQCSQFLICVNGIGYTMDCPEGLAFNELTFRCDWPDQVDTCDAEAFLGFKCPHLKNELESYKLYPHLNDCQKFYLCVSGRPRLYNCGTGLGFNENINACDIKENVSS
ncbi:protein obstructor-E-like isoform X2 [Daktulosphaira vitifoliae]|nr:protein obstructor-E-like isoform X2 [Daktulosphaira vitifoliae]